MDIDAFKKILWEYTRKIAENTNLAIQPLCEQHGLTMLQVRILIAVYQHDRHTIGSLANQIHMAGTNISTMCKKLENMGYMERVRDPEDERVVKVTLTETGREVVRKIDAELTEKVSTYIQFETEETIENIIVGLQKLNGLLEKMGNNNK